MHLRVEDKGGVRGLGCGVRGSEAYWHVLLVLCRPAGRRLQQGRQHELAGTIELFLKWGFVRIRLPFVQGSLQWVKQCPQGV